MSWHVRAASARDIDELYQLAMLTGGGFTNLPQDKDALAQRLARSDTSYARADEAPHDELYMLVLAHTDTGRLGGTAVVFSRIGVDWPFYSYKLGTLQQQSRELGRTITHQLLNLTTDHDGASEVGGLFLHPELRTGGLGKLLARSRYLFIAQHRARFADRLMAELRGVLTDDGHSPFWDGLGAKFFGMSFPEADRFNSLNGNQFIADLMPRHPIYVELLGPEARAVIGQPHARGVPALRMLEGEGFAYDGYIDIFDGGPTVTARTDHVRTIRDSAAGPVTALAEDGHDLHRALAATGRLADFRAWLGHAGSAGNGVVLPRGEAGIVQVGLGEEVRHVPI